MPTQQLARKVSRSRRVLGRVWLLITPKTLVVASLAVASTALCKAQGWEADFPLTLISTAVIFPIVFSIGGAYKRRESALDDYGTFKAHGQAIFFATRDWVPEPDEAQIERCRAHLRELMESVRAIAGVVGFSS